MSNKTTNNNKHKTMGTITPGFHELQIWSRSDDPIRPDHFRLEDGRMIEIMAGSQVDAERTRHSVWIRTNGHSYLANYGNGHRYIKGCAGSIYFNRKHGNWELCPIERGINREARGTFEKYGIHCDRKASARTAALELIELSDGLMQKNCGFYESKAITRKAGPWRITPLAKYADGTDLAQDPNSIRLDHDRTRHYVCNHDKHGSIRVIATRDSCTYGYSLGIYVVPAPGIHNHAEHIQQCPGKVKAWIESRIRSI